MSAHLALHAPATAAASFMPPLPSTTSSGHRQLSRNTVIVLAVVGLHASGLWALQSGLLRRAVEVVVGFTFIRSPFLEPVHDLLSSKPKNAK